MEVLSHSIKEKGVFYYDGKTGIFTFLYDISCEVPV